MIKTTVLEYIEKHFPAPCYFKTDKYEVGTILYTSNPYFRTNATIIGIVRFAKTPSYVVLTDIGNIIEQTEVDLSIHYLPPVCKRTDKMAVDWWEHFTFSPNLAEFKYDRRKEVRLHAELYEKQDR